MLMSFCLKSTIAQTLVLLQAMKMSAISNCKKMFNISSLSSLSTKLYFAKSGDSFSKLTIQVMKNKQLPYLVLAATSQSIKKLSCFQKQKKFYIAQLLYLNKISANQKKYQILNISRSSSIFLTSFAPVMFRLKYSYWKRLIFNENKEQCPDASSISNHVSKDDLDFELREYQLRCRPKTTPREYAKSKDKTEENQSFVAHAKTCQSTFEQLSGIVQRQKCLIFNLIDYIVTQYNSFVVFSVLTNEIENHSATAGNLDNTDDETAVDNNEISPYPPVAKSSSESCFLLKLPIGSIRDFNLAHLYVFSAVLTFIAFSLRMFKFASVL